jgi:biofilm protein TabA
MAYTPLKYLNEIIYHNEKDLKVLKGKITSTIHLKKSDFTVFFPEDAHMPGLNPNELSNKVEKIIVKIKV